ncbi:MAG: peptidoglycan-binding protein [Gammaproteobacteria bacterium]|nr:peptidoglycan-binding protein [Gammaproteobacteria bacterium]
MMLVSGACSTGGKHEFVRKSGGATEAAIIISALSALVVYNAENGNIKKWTTKSVRTIKGWLGSSSKQRSQKELLNEQQKRAEVIYGNWSKANPDATPHASEVALAQSIVAVSGDYEGKVDGINGPLTKKAVQKFQNRAGLLPANGNPHGLIAMLKMKNT